MDDVLKLISCTFPQDQFGVRRRKETAREIFCQVEDVTRAEFFAGGRNGLQPEYTFVIPVIDYGKELICEYKGERFAIYRTYKRSADRLELHVQKEGGLNGKKENQTVSA